MLKSNLKFKYTTLNKKLEIFNLKQKFTQNQSKLLIKRYFFIKLTGIEK
jgi:hypothetical protein